MSQAAPEVLAKSGPELFRELYRIYPVAEVEDYFKNGVWKDEVMRTDISLVEAHRKEGGAPDAPDLKDVKMPEMPAAKAVSLAGAIGGVRPPGAVAGAAQSPAAAASIQELRLIALFVAKWKLDPTQAKAKLAKLTPTRRRYVIQNFKTTVAGAPALAALDAFISQNEKSGAWDKGAPAVVSGPGVAATPRPVATVAARPAVVAARPAGMTPVGGLKRPVAAVNPALDPSKRPRVGVPAAVRPQVRPQIPKAQPPKAGGPRPAGSLIKGLLNRV